MLDATLESTCSTPLCTKRPLNLITPPGRLLAPREYATVVSRRAATALLVHEVRRRAPLGLRGKHTDFPTCTDTYLGRGQEPISAVAEFRKPTRADLA